MPIPNEKIKLAIVDIDLTLFNYTLYKKDHKNGNLHKRFFYEGTVEFVQELLDKGHKIAFVTNNDVNSFIPSLLELLQDNDIPTDDMITLGLNKASVEKHRVDIFDESQNGRDCSKWFEKFDKTFLEVFAELANGNKKTGVEGEGKPNIKVFKRLCEKLSTPEDGSGIMEIKIFGDNPISDGMLGVNIAKETSVDCNIVIL